MAPLQTLEVRRVPASADLERAGDYCFVPKREPELRHEMTVIEHPTKLWAFLWWVFRGRPIQYKGKEVIEIVWPDYDAIVMLCPHCNQGIGTTKDHKIVSLEPLTIEKPLACAYSRGAQFDALPSVVFEIKDGKIMPA